MGFIDTIKSTPKWFNWFFMTVFIVGNSVFAYVLIFKIDTAYLSASWPLYLLAWMGGNCLMLIFYSFGMAITESDNL